jgi:hypothetical protein
MITSTYESSFCYIHFWLIIINQVKNLLMNREIQCWWIIIPFWTRWNRKILVKKEFMHLFPSSLSFLNPLFSLAELREWERKKKSKYFASCRLYVDKFYKKFTVLTTIQSVNRFLCSFFLKNKISSRPDFWIHDRHIDKVPLQGSIPMRTQTYIQTYPLNKSIRVQCNSNNKTNFII